MSRRHKSLWTQFHLQHKNAKLSIKMENTSDYQKLSWFQQLSIAKQWKCVATWDVEGVTPLLLSFHTMQCHLLHTQTLEKGPCYSWHNHNVYLSLLPTDNFEAGSSDARDITTYSNTQLTKAERWTTFWKATWDVLSREFPDKMLPF